MFNHILKSPWLASGLAFALALGVVNLAQAENVPARDMQYFTEPPAVEDLARHLFPARTRGLVISAKQGTNDAASTTSVSETPEKSIGLPVLFHFGKTTLVESSKPYLDQVGKLMQQVAYQNETLIIEGHTDAVGSADYNEHLSELRALAVKQYLVQQYDIDPLRLFPQGKGESLLFDRQNPKANVNRRVEFLRFQPG